MKSLLASTVLTAAALSHWVAPSAAAQALAAPADTTAKADPIDATAKVPPLLYRSAFAGYRPNVEEKVGDWKETNDKVGRIGGWREYAKEARQPEAKNDDGKAAPGGHVDHSKP